MENLREQIFQVVNNFLTTVQQLTAQHTAQVLQETFSSLNGNKQRASSTASASASASASAPSSRGAKRGADELEQLSKRFFQFVQDNPGLRIEQINKQLGTTTTELALPIRKLVASGGLTVRGQKRSTTYFAGKGSATSAVASDSDSDGESDGESKPAGKSREKRGRSKKSRSGRSKSKK